MLPGAELDVGRAGSRAPGPGPGDQLGKTAIAVGTDDEIDLRNALEQLGPEPLRHAADHAQHVTGTLVALELAHAPEHPLLGVVAHRAGVHQQDVGLRGVVGTDVPLAAEHAEDELGVGDVHLAAVRFDVDAWHAQLTVMSSRGRPSQARLER